MTRDQFLIIDNPKLNAGVMVSFPACVYGLLLSASQAQLDWFWAPWTPPQQNPSSHLSFEGT